MVFQTLCKHFALPAISQKRFFVVEGFGLWRGSLLPLGCEAAPKNRTAAQLQREQAPSPQKPSESSRFIR
ncbi:hypothetical protein PFAS1_24440 [Pseudomonas frederiksbergensis]|nr:hypothetical protein PFAS1_24440 [Pseudomonas frederiksbergensis]